MKSTSIRMTGDPDSRTRAGFTLVELMVVISIIALLTSVILGSLNAARTRGNDARRKADLTQLRISLDLYYDAHAAFPSTGGSWFAVAPPVTVTEDWIPNLTTGGFTKVLPQDPTYPQLAGGVCGTTWPSMYLYRSVNGTGYSLLAHCPAHSNVATTPPSDPLYDSLRPTWAWKVCVGTECNE